MSTPVLFERSANGVLTATLNAEKSLNALSLDMIETLHAELDRAAQDSAVSMVFLQGAGTKAFCAGGDIRKLYDSIVEAEDAHDNPYAARFFEQEYKLDYKIHTYPKPVLCWGHGIVMGGGLGLFAGSSCRVVVETSKIAMPEITIGLYPDVGATYFLNQMPQGAGLYLALTGTRMNAGDALFTGLADFYMRSSDKDALVKALHIHSWSNDARQNQRSLRQIVSRLSESRESEIPTSEVKDHLPFLREIGACPALEQVVKIFDKARTGSDAWVKSGVETFFKGSPTSAHVMFEQLKRGEKLDLKQAFMMEVGLTIQFAWHHDFREGVRALLIDKDNKPRWKPAQLSEVSRELVAEHFDSPWGAGPNPLRDLKEPAKNPLR
jgi:enoyl-CoA hydratase/carnithine racemase